MLGDMLYKRLQRGYMRNVWLALAIFVSSLIAAEKSRDWQTGQVIESKADTDPRVHAIAGVNKTYFVRGSIGGDEDVLAVGATVRYAVQGTTMFLSIAGNEYRLSVLGATVRTAPPTPPASPAVTPARQDPVLPPPSAAAGKPPAAAKEPLLDNDAVVKMIVGGLKEDTVVSVIEARPGKYNLAPDALAALRAAGVPQRVITAMSAKMSAQH
jgi:hypothetical protein